MRLRLTSCTGQAIRRWPRSTRRGHVRSPAKWYCTRWRLRKVASRRIEAGRFKSWTRADRKTHGCRVRNPWQPRRIFCRGWRRRHPGSPFIGPAANLLRSRRSGRSPIAPTAGRARRPTSHCTTAAMETRSNRNPSWTRRRTNGKLFGGGGCFYFSKSGF